MYVVKYFYFGKKMAVFLMFAQVYLQSEIIYWYLFGLSEISQESIFTRVIFSIFTVTCFSICIFQKRWHLPLVVITFS